MCANWHIQIYRKDDAPYYRRGNTAIIPIVVWNGVFAMAIKGYYMWRNKTREAKWNAMSEQEKNDYLETTDDRGSKRLDFRFAH